MNKSELQEVVNDEKASASMKALHVIVGKAMAASAHELCDDPSDEKQVAALLMQMVAPTALHNIMANLFRYIRDHAEGTCGHQECVEEEFLELMEKIMFSAIENADRVDVHTLH